MKLKFKDLAILFGLFFTSCYHDSSFRDDGVPTTINLSTLPADVQLSLNFAGENKPELLKVISHYQKFSKDSLKLKSAYFLIANMGHFYYYKGGLLNKYLDYPDYLPSEMQVRKIDANYFEPKFGRFSYEALDVCYEIKEITAQQLQNNIELAFKAWQKEPWSQNYNFNQFCEFILPWRMNNEIPEYNRNKLYCMFDEVLDSVRSRNGDAVDACTAINNELKKKGWFLVIGLEYLPHMPISKLLSYQTGACRDQADLGAYVMRSQGIPVSIDFVPQWPTRGGNHTFNAVINKDGKPILFNAADDNPGLSTHIDMKKGKVYRRIFYKNMESLAVLKDPEEDIPPLFMDSYIRDVTDEYCDCTDIHLFLKKTTTFKRSVKHAYLCVFDNKEWVPIGWAKIINDSLIFKNVEVDNLYMPAIYIGDTIISIGDPFIAKKGNILENLRPDLTHLIDDIKIKKMFPITPDRTAKLNGSFQGANNSQFHHAVNIYSFLPTHKTSPFWNKIEIKSKDSFRFVRYFQKSACTAGEIELYSRGNKLKGNIIGSAPMQKNNLFSIDKAFDGDMSTSFLSEDNDSWVGLDLGKNQKLDSILVAPGIGLYGPSYKIVSGHRYELRCWYQNKWFSISDTTASEDEVLLCNVPSNGLYLLQDINTQESSRVFTIRDGIQKWL